MSVKSVSEIIFQTLDDLGVRDCFCVVGGGAMHLNRALGMQDSIKTHFNHHEQACAMAAEAYARYEGVPAVVCVTSGPGATNTLTGVMGAWVDSLPMIVVSGNVRRNASIAGSGLPLRYRGIQEFDIVNSVQNMTKRAVVLDDPLAARAEVRKAYEVAMAGRRGPVWIDVPLDVQNTMVAEEDLLPDYGTEVLPAAESDAVRDVLQGLATAKRPCVLFGSAMTTASLHDEFIRFLANIQVPVVGGAWLGDVLPLDKPLYYGSSGNVGPRTGNFVLENADFILVLGNSLSYKQTGYKLDMFAPHATIAMVEVDEGELRKLGDKVDVPIHATLQSFFAVAEKLGIQVRASESWIAHCDALKSRFSPYEGGFGADSADRVNKYYFWERFNTLMPEDTVLVLGNSQIGLSINQIGKARDGQRMIANYICGSMGYDLPAAIGVAVAASRPVVCATGDGSFMMNLQELATIAHAKLPIRIILFENGGYGGIRQSQTNYFGDFDFGSGPQSGVGFPEFSQVAKAFGVPYRVCETNGDVDDELRWLANAEGPVLLEVKEVLDDPVVPKMLSKLAPDGSLTEPLLCDLSPFISDEELAWALSPSREKDGL